MLKYCKYDNDWLLLGDAKVRIFKTPKHFGFNINSLSYLEV